MAVPNVGGDQPMSNVNAAVLLPVVQPPEMWEHNQNTYFFQESNVLLKHCFHPARSKKTTIPINTVTPHPKFLAYFHKTEIGRRKGLDSLTPNELAQISSNLPSDLQQELLNEDDEGENDKFRHSQKFKFEQCKQAAFNLLRKVAFTLENFDEEEQTVTEELESLLLESLDQLSANAAYEKRDWQTQAYKEEALALERERAEMVVTPSLLQAPSTGEESLKGGATPANAAASLGLTGTASASQQQGSQPQPNSGNNLSVPPTPMASKKTVGKLQTAAMRAPSAQLASIVVTAASVAGSSRPGTTDGMSENRDTLGPLPSAQTISKLKGAFRGSARQRKSSGSRGGDSSDEGSETGSRRSRLSTRSGNRSNSLNWQDQSSQADQIVTVSFSLDSKECEEKGWIVHSEQDSNAEDKRYTAVLIYKMVHASANKIRDEMILSEKQRGGAQLMPVQIDYWGNRKMNLRHQKRGKAVDMHGGDTRLLPWPIRPESNFSQAYTGYCCLPDGTQTINYKNGQLAVLFDKLTPHSTSFYCTIYSEEGNLQALILPGCRGTITLSNYSSPTLSLLGNRGGIMYNQEGDTDRVFSWPIFANKLLEPISLHVNDKITIRVLNSNQIYLTFNYHAEKYKINLTRKMKGDGDSAIGERGNKELSPHLLTDLRFVSKTARDLENPKKKSGRLSRLKSPVKRAPSDSTAEVNGTGGGGGVVRGLDLPGERERPRFENELLSLQVRVEYLFEEWLEFYRIHLGMPSPLLKNVPPQPIAPKRGFSARSTPAAALRVLEELMLMRSQSAAAKLKYLPQNVLMMGSTGITRTSSARGLSGVKRTASVPPIKLLQYQGSHANSLAATSPRSGAVSQANRHPESSRAGYDSKPRTARELKKKVAIAGAVKTPRDRSKEIAQDEKQLACPVSLRARLSGKRVASDFKCSCSPYRPPEVRDIEVDHFVQHCIPAHQILVIVIVDHQDNTRFQAREMYDNIYSRMSRNRTSPCFQSKTDPFRLVYYDLSNAKLPETKMSSHKVHESMTSLLQLRHRVHPGMLMMFCRGQLYFANEIFDGYGVSRQDFFRQVDRTKRDVDKNDWLPEDFKFGQPIKTKIHEKVSITVIDISEKEMMEILEGAGDEETDGVTRQQKRRDASPGGKSDKDNLRSELTMIEGSDTLQLSPSPSRRGNRGNKKKQQDTLKQSQKSAIKA